MNKIVISTYLAQKKKSLFKKKKKAGSPIQTKTLKNNKIVYNKKGCLFIF
jgi:hypothetical protein